MFEKNSIIGQIAKGEYPEKSVKTTYGDFKIKYPSGKDLQVIAMKKASWLGGHSINSHSMEYVGRAHRDSTLAVVIVDYPKDFPEKFQKDNIDDFPDEEVKNSILKEFNIFYSDTQDEISGKSRS